MKVKEINIYGASGHAKVVIDAILSQEKLRIGYVFDDNSEIKCLQEHPVYKPSEQEKLNKYPVVFTIGDNIVRKKVVQQMKLKASPAIIHANSIQSLRSTIREGTVVMAGAIINADAQIGRHAIVNTGAIIEHDCILEDYVHLSPNAALAGNVFVGEGTHIGIGAQVIQGIKIGKWCTVGAGAVIIRDVPDGTTVVGNPGRIIK